MYKIGTTATGNIIVEMTSREWEAVLQLFRASDGITVDIGQALKQYRQRQGMPQLRVAQQLGISKSYVSLIERGLAENVSVEIKNRIAILIRRDS